MPDCNQTIILQDIPGKVSFLREESRIKACPVWFNPDIGEHPDGKCCIHGKKEEACDYKCIYWVCDATDCKEVGIHEMMTDPYIEYDAVQSDGGLTLCHSHHNRLLRDFERMEWRKEEDGSF